MRDAWKVDHTARETSPTLFELYCGFFYVPASILSDLATGRERQLTTEKRAENTKHDLRCPICRSAIGQASCLICARRRQLTFPFFC